MPEEKQIASKSSPRWWENTPFMTVTNDNGEKLVTTCKALSLRPAKFRFSQSAVRQWSWMHSSGTKAQISHILIQSKWVNSLRNCGSYSSVELDLDHCIVPAVVKLSLRCTKMAAGHVVILNWLELMEDATLQSRFTTVLTYPALCDVLYILQRSINIL